MVYHFPHLGKEPAVSELDLWNPAQYDVRNRRSNLNGAYNGGWLHIHRLGSFRNLFLS